MPIFGDIENPYAADAATLAPLTNERLVATLETLEVAHVVDEDGDLVAGFDGNPCWFRLAGPEGQEIAFSFHTRWRGLVPADEWPQALVAVNEWNAAQPFPRALCFEDGAGGVLFGADYLHDYEFGVTDQQLVNDVQVAVTCALNYYAFLDEQFAHGLPEDEPEPLDEEPDQPVQPVE